MSKKPELCLRGADNLRQQLNANQKRKIRQFYLDVYDDVRGEIDRLKNMPQNASVRLHTMRLDQVGGELKAAYNRLYTELESKIVKDMTSVSNAVVNESADFLKNIGLSIGPKYTSFSTGVVEDLYFGKVYKGNWTLSKAIWGDYKGVNDDISRIIAKGVAEGKGTYDIAKALETYVNPNAQKPWYWSRFYPGSKLKVDYNAVRLARTEISHAYQQSIIRTAAANPFASGIIWHKNSSHDCEYCENMVSRNPHPINDCPLDHPNGFCTFTIQLEKSLDQIADEIVDWVNGGENKRLDEFVKRKYIEKPKKVVNIGLTGAAVGKTANIIVTPPKGTTTKVSKGNPALPVTNSSAGYAAEVITPGGYSGGNSEVYRDISLTNDRNGDKIKKGRIYSFEEYNENPLLLGESTAEEKYEHFRKTDYAVTPLKRGNLKDVAFEKGGGYIVDFGDSQTTFMYHPEERSHHDGKYYKLSTGKTGARRFDMRGRPKK